MVKILSIETSCDETAAAVVEDGQKVISSIVSTQIDFHKKYGGVVPELAARMHIEAILPVIDEALIKANLGWDEIDALATTEGPGLLGSLLIGVNTAKTLGYLKNKPIIPINHLEGHIYANFIKEFEGQKIQETTPEFPLILLIISGGHTNIVYMKDHLNYETIGQTIDDAAGEAFDKVAKVLGLGYPGGPIVSKLAVAGNKDKFKFPRIDLTPPPLRDEEGYLREAKPSLNFSFSGLKTAVINEVRKKEELDDQFVADICASFQQAVIDVLIRNSLIAIKTYKVKTFMLSGGVAANTELKSQFRKALKKEKIELFVPPAFLCTDNAAMIGAIGGYKLKAGFTENWDKVSENPNLRL